MSKNKFIGGRSSLEDNEVQAPLSNDDKNKLTQLMNLGFSEEMVRKVIQENPG